VVTGQASGPELDVEGWFWPGLAGLSLLGWLATLLRLKGLPLRRRPAVRAAAGPSSQALRAARQAVEQACRANDAHGARAALLAWGHARWGRETPAGLGALAKRLGDGATAEILAELDRALYADDREPWDGIEAWRALAPSLSLIDTQAESKGKPALPGLYPRQV
jgi:hypothetical protein